MKDNRDSFVMENKKNFKIIVLGNIFSGKTSIIKRLTENKFENDPKATKSPNCVTKVYEINGKFVNFNIWDIPGQDRKPVITKTFAKGADGIIYCCDIKDITSREDLKKWEENLESIEDIEKIPKILIENKCDVLGGETNYNDNINSLKKTANELGCLNFYRTSALNGYNIEKSFRFLFDNIIKNEKIKEIQRNDSYVMSERNHKKKKDRCC